MLRSGGGRCDTLGSLEAGSEREISVQEMSEGVLEPTHVEGQEGSRIRGREKTSCDAVSVEATAHPAESSEAQVVSDLNPM